MRTFDQWCLPRESPQGRDRVTTPLGFQDAVTQDTRKHHLVSLSQERLDQMIF